MDQSLKKLKKPSETTTTNRQTNNNKHKNTTNTKEKNKKIFVRDLKKLPKITSRDRFRQSQNKTGKNPPKTTQKTNILSRYQPNSNK